MNAEMILKSDLIDLVFESRNKEYGAYQLRKLYKKHLMIAIGGPLFILLLSWWVVDGSGTNIIKTIGPAFTDTTVIVIQPPPSIPLPPVERFNRKAASAEMENNIPVITNKEVVSDVPEVSELEDVIIGTKTIDPIGDPAPPMATVSEIPPAPTPEPAIYVAVEQMPEFPGGLHGLSRFLSKHLRVPEEIEEPGTRIRILVNFVVAQDGSLQSVQFKDSIPVAYAREIRRVFMKMPRWNPGSQHGKLVSVYYHLPIIFEIPEQ